VVPRHLKVRVVIDCRRVIRSFCMKVMFAQAA